VAAAAGDMPSELRLLYLVVFENGGDAARRIAFNERLQHSPKRRGEASRGSLNGRHGRETDSYSKGNALFCAFVTQSLHLFLRQDGSQSVTVAG
jgi:hypothetical protein